MRHGKTLMEEIRLWKDMEGHKETWEDMGTWRYMNGHQGEWKEMEGQERTWM